MVKEIIIAKEGYEKVVAVFDELIANIEEAKAEEIAAIELKYAERLDKYNKDRDNYVSVEIIEVPDEPVEDEQTEIGEELEVTNAEFQSV